MFCTNALCVAYPIHYREEDSLEFHCKVHITLIIGSLQSKRPSFCTIKLNVHSVQTRAELWVEKPYARMEKIERNILVHNAHFH